MPAKRFDSKLADGRPDFIFSTIPEAERFEKFLDEVTPACGVAGQWYFVEGRIAGFDGHYIKSRPPRHSSSRRRRIDAVLLHTESPIVGIDAFADQLEDRLPV
jgi:hypothetical protein